MNLAGVVFLCMLVAIAILHNILRVERKNHTIQRDSLAKITNEALNGARAMSESLNRMREQLVLESGARFNAERQIGILFTTALKHTPDYLREQPVCEWAAERLPDWIKAVEGYRRLYDQMESFGDEIGKTGVESILQRADVSLGFPRNVKVLTDEIGNALYMPDKIGQPKRAFVYLHIPDRNSASISRKHLHQSEDFSTFHRAVRVTFVLDEWLSVGEVHMKLRRAAAALADSKAVTA